MALLALVCRKTANKQTNKQTDIDSDVSMSTHVSKTVSSCFSALRQIRSIRRSVSRPVLLSLVVSMVLTRLDYGSAALAGLPGQLLNKLQSVLNAAARLVCSARKYDHITPLLSDLHWLPRDHSFKMTVTTLSERFSKVSSRSIIEFIKTTGLYRKI